MMEMTRIIEGDCLDTEIEPGTVNLIVTSPPYAQQRKDTYGGVHPDEYIDWFLPRARRFAEMLTPDGSFCLNIKESVVDGERHQYVHDLVRELRSEGWLWIDTYMWTKPAAMPGAWPNRLRDGWEPIWHFARRKKIKFRKENVMVPQSDSLRNKLAGNPIFDRNEVWWNRTGSGFNIKLANFDRLNGMAYPPNVLSVQPANHNMKHPAVFPLGLPEFFIGLFTDKGDVVLDPFMGSGTTLVAARAMGRYSTGIDMSPEYCRLAENRLLRTAAYSHGGLLDEIA